MILKEKLDEDILEGKGEKFYLDKYNPLQFGHLL
jgi:hypothetical protein